MKQKEISDEKTNKKKEYLAEEQGVTTHVVAEPVVAYVNIPNAEANRTIAIMGMEGKRDFANVKNENDFISIIRAGVPKQAMTHLMAVADISLNEMAAIIHTSDRTLRRYAAHQKLSQEQSERMIELAKLYSRGEDVLGTMVKFREWMDTALLPFGNKKPKEFLDTFVGIKMIMDELGRIEHGIFA